MKNPGGDAGVHQLAWNPVSPELSEKPPGAAESIIQAGLENVEFTVAEGTIAAEVHHVVLNLRGPVFPQSIFSPDAKHPPTDSFVYRKARQEHGRAVEARACMSPCPAKFAIDEPAIEGVTEPRSKRRDPIEVSMDRADADKLAFTYGRPSDIRFEAEYPLIDLVIEPDLTAAEKAAAVAAAVAVGPPHAEMSAGIESGPVKEWDWRRWRPVGRTARRIGGFGYSGRGCKQHRGQTKLQQPGLTHFTPPSVKVGDRA